jgi:hypothetical protein
MSAYTNPETYIDTQSAQYLQNLQSTIAGSFAKVAESYASRQQALRKEKEENQKILKANDMKAQEYSFSLYTDLAKAGEGDKTVDWAKTFNPLIEESVTLRTGLLNGTLQDKQAAIKRLAQIQASVDGVTGSLANLSEAGSTYKESLDKGISAQGGLSSWNDPKVTSALDVLTQRIPGNKEPFFKDNDPSKLMWRVTDDKGGLLYEFDASQLDKISKGQGLIKTIPNQIEAFDTLKTTNTGIFGTTQSKVGGKEVTIPNGQVNPEFLKPDQKEVVVMQSEGKKITKMVQEVDLDMVRRDGNLNTTLQAQAEGLLADQTSAIDFYNDIISDDKGLYKGTGFNFDPRQPLYDAGKKKFIDDYKEYFIQTQVTKTQDVIKPGEDTFTTTYTTPKPSKAKGTVGAKETAAQISQKTLDQKVKDLITTGKGAVIGKGGRTLTKLDGKWSVIGSDGLPVAGSENITNPTVLATFLGGSAKKKAAKKVELP